MTPEARKQKMESYGNAYSQLADALEKFPKEMWQFRDEHGCWSIHEHIVHVADSEANSYIPLLSSGCRNRAGRWWTTTKTNGPLR